MVSNSIIAGKNLTPLPFESALCSLWRFGWRNTLNSAHLRELCSKKAGYSTKDCTKNLDWIDTEKFQNISGWELPSIHERRFIDSIRGSNEIWIASTLRYCPLCLELGYHSFLQQLVVLQICPLHRVPLVTYCHSCGERMPNFRHSPEVYNHPYICKCGQPYSGVAPSLQLDEFLRAHSLQIEHDFGAIMKWWESSTRVRDLNSRFWNPMVAATNNMGNWCDVSEFIRSLSINDLPIQECFHSPQFRKSIKLDWKIRCAKNSSPLGTWLPNRDWQTRVQISNPVYRVVLRRIQRWIVKTDDLSQEDFENSLTIHSKSIKDFNPRILALLCFRTQFEDRLWEGKPWNPRSAQIKDEPAIDIVRYEGRTPRQSWLAVFLGLYTHWYFRILRSKNQSLSEMGFFQNGESANILMWNEVNELDHDHWWSGSVVFPFLEDLLSLCCKGFKLQCESPLSKNHSSYLLSSVEKSSDVSKRISRQPNLLEMLDKMSFVEFDNGIEIYINDLSNNSPSEVNTALDVSLKNNDDTRRCYQFELERYLCWCIVQYKKQPIEMTELECKKYPAFLARPEPFEFWMGDEGRSLFGERWHPFRVKLSPSSVRRALRVVNGFYRFLSDRGLVSRELQVPIPSTPIPDWSANTGRGLSQEAWQFLLLRMNDLPNTIKDIRLKFTIKMLYGTGLRISELVRARTNDLYLIRPLSAKRSGNRWHLKVHNASGKARIVELCDDLATLLSTYLVSRGHSEKLMDSIDKSIPLISPLLQPISFQEMESTVTFTLVSEASIRTQVKSFFVLCGDDPELSDPKISAELRNISPGNFRNTHILNSLDAGNSPSDIGARIGLSGLNRVVGFNKRDVWNSPREIDMVLEMEKFFDSFKK
jgi:site-specific recombinase XerD